jgi:hypothetical protein
VLVGASIGSWIGGLFGGFVAALLAIPAAGALQVIVREAWRVSGPPIRKIPDDPAEPSPAASGPGEPQQPGEPQPEGLGPSPSATEPLSVSHRK